MAKNTVSKFNPETCKAIIAEILEKVMLCPKKPEEWKEVATKFAQRWNFTHALVALDGKHVTIKKFPLKCISFYNHKRFYSNVLLALEDGKCKFSCVDISAHWCSTDGEVFHDTPTS